ncbi:MAG: CHC2 zinc finger domain-containing protein [Verrucomicrobia bacterium]|nr:CHC2 zinc finger domain-containing protein [Verrucomicrobiota bacterium]
MTSRPVDLFAEARERFTIADAWTMLQLPGEPKASCRSPFRDERTPSFSIHSDGRAWTDHGTDEGGDVVEFIRHAIGGDHRDVRQWLADRIGVDTAASAHSKPAKTAEGARRIVWPAELVEGTQETWTAFAKLRWFTYASTHVMVSAGILRFCRLPDGIKCYVVTDHARRAAEIRRIDGKPFGDSKAYKLRGVDKSWLPGSAMLEAALPETSVLVVEGATDLLTALDLYVRFRRDHGGIHSWQPVALLGAGCKIISPECAALIRGRHVRMVPDADHAGDGMRDHWTQVFRHLGCTVDVVTLPRGTDLTDNHKMIQPTDLFSK